MKFFAFCCLFFTCQGLFATNYYISNSGNDSWPGTEPDSAFQNLSMIQTLNLLPGDTVFFNRGDVFAGQLILNIQGSILNPIVFTTYGSAANEPVISGLVPTNGWTVWNGNIYTCNFSNSVFQVFANNKFQTSARFPNSGWLRVDSMMGQSGFKDFQLLQDTNYWKGSTAHIRTNDIAYEYAAIDSFVNGKFHFSTPTIFATPIGNGFYLDHNFSELDSSGEWYYDNVLQKLFYQFANGQNPASTSVSVCIYSNGISMAPNSNFIEINGLQFTGQYDAGISLNSSCNNISISNCKFEGQYLQGIYLDNNCTSISVNNNQFSNISGDGIRCLFPSNTFIQQNVFKNFGLSEGQGLSEPYNGTAILLNHAFNSTIQENHIDSVSFAGIICNGNHNNILKNFIDHCMLKLNYGGGIYTYTNQSHHNVYADNFVFNSIGNNETENGQSILANGIFIYFDCDTITLNHNLTANCFSNGILIGETNTRHLISHNTSYNNGVSQLCVRETFSGNSIHNLTIKNNTLYSLNRNQDQLLLVSQQPPFTPMIIDSNIYCNPYNFFAVRESNLWSGHLTNEEYNLRRWQQVSQHDMNGFQLPLHLENLKVTDTTGSDLLLNGNFTNNYNNWAVFPDSNNLFLLDNATSLDGGCLKVQVNANDPVDTCSIHSSNFNLVANQAYQFSFSDSALLNDFLWIDTKENAMAYNFLNFIQAYPVDTFRQNFKTVFINNRNFSPSRLDISLSRRDSVVWFDNMHLFPVNATVCDSAEISKLFYNWSPSSLTISLNGILYRDIFGNPISGSITLNPYDFKILIQDTAFYSSVASIQNINPIIVYPNPSHAGDMITIQSENIWEEPVVICIYNIQGQLLNTQKFSKQSKQIQFSSNLTEGIYLIEIKGSGINIFKKLIVIN